MADNRISFADKRKIKVGRIVSTDLHLLRVNRISLANAHEFILSVLAE